MKILSYTYEDEGLKRVYENEKWTVAIKNYKPANDIANLDNVERHNKTDEFFILLQGKCTLIFANEENGKLVFEKEVMKPNTVYNIPQSLWHNTITEKDTKMILVEDVSTCMDNSDIRKLTEDELKIVRNLVKG